MKIEQSPKLDFTEEMSTCLRVCPKCGGHLALDTEYRNRENKVTHWKAICTRCGAQGTLFND